MKNLVLPDAQKDLDKAIDEYIDFANDVLLQYFVSWLSSGILGVMGANIMVGSEASDLMEDIVIARERVETVEDQIEVIEKQIKKIFDTHDFDDIFNNQNYHNDGGCNDNNV